MISSFTLSAVLSAINGKPGLLAWTGLANFGAFSVQKGAFIRKKALPLPTGSQLQLVGADCLLHDGRVRWPKRSAIQLPQHEIDDLSPTVSM